MTGKGKNVAHLAVSNTCMTKLYGDDRVVDNFKAFLCSLQHAVYIGVFSKMYRVWSGDQDADLEDLDAFCARSRQTCNAPYILYFP